MKKYMYVKYILKCVRFKHTEREYGWYAVQKFSGLFGNFYYCRIHVSLIGHGDNLYN